MSLAERFTEFAYVWGGLAFASAWQGTVASIIAVALLSRCTRLSAATRVAMWWVALFACVAVPVCVGWPIAISAPESTRPQPQTVMVVSGKIATGPSIDPAVTVTTLPRATHERPPTARGVTVSPAIVQTIAAAWIVVAAALLVRLALGVVTILSTKRRSSPAPAPVGALLERIGAPSVVVRITDDFTVPVVVGYVRPMVLLPRQTLEHLDDVALGHVLLHEIAHVRGGDVWAALMLRLMRAVMFPFPAIHIIARRLEIDQELACDEWAMHRAGAKATDYATSLLRVGEATLRLGSTLTPAAATQLRYRIEALLGGRVRHPSRHWWSRGTFIGVAFAGALIPLSAVAPSIALIRVGDPQPPAPKTIAAPPVQLLSPTPATNIAKTETPRAEPLTDTLKAWIEQLGAPDAETRAHAAFALSLRRAEAIDATPALIALLGDDERVARSDSATSKSWHAGEDRDATSPAEEAGKALLYIGRGALEPLSAAFATLSTSGRRRAGHIVGLLKDFD